MSFVLFQHHSHARVKACPLPNGAPPRKGEVWLELDSMTDEEAPPGPCSPTALATYCLLGQAGRREGHHALSWAHRHPLGLSLYDVHGGFRALGQPPWWSPPTPSPGPCFIQPSAFSGQRPGEESSVCPFHRAGSGRWSVPSNVPQRVSWGAEPRQFGFWVSTLCRRNY